MAKSAKKVKARTRKIKAVVGRAKKKRGAAVAARPKKRAAPAKKAARKVVARTKGRAPKKMPKKAPAAKAKKAMVAKAPKKRASAKAPKKALAANPKKALVAKKTPVAKKAPVAKVQPRTPIRREDHAGHLAPEYAAELRALSGKDEDTGRGFLGGAHTRDDLAEGLGEEFVQTATSGEDEGEDRLDQVVAEETGGPFVESSGSTEFADGTDESNPKGAKREPFPTT